MAGKAFSKKKTASISLRRNRVRKTRKGKITLVVDIRSSSVGAALVRNFKGKNKTPVVLDSRRHQIFYTEKPGTAEFVKRTYQTLNKILEEVTDHRREYGRISNAHVFYGPPWYKGSIKEVEKKEKKKITLKNKKLRDILQKNREKSQNKTEHNIEEKIFSIKLNGYKTKKPLNSKFKELVINLYESYIHTDTHKQVTHFINNYLPDAPVEHHSHPLAIHEFISEKFEPVDNYTMIDISGEITEITVVRKDEIKKIVSVPHGSHFFVRGMSKKCNIDHLHAFSKLDMILSKEIDQECKRGSFKAFKEMKNEWADSIRDILKKAKIRSLPNNVFVFVDNEVLALTKDILNDPEIHSGALRFGKKPKLFFVNSDEVKDLCLYRESVEKDAIISMEASFVEIIE
jgi:hypothetical protein